MGRYVALLVALAVLAGCGADEEPAAPAAKGPVLDGKVRRLNGDADDLAKYRGKVVLVVNTATECGFTSQFDGLQKLYDSRRGKGLVLLGFPSNDFAGQEPRSNKEIGDFCRLNYGVTFPMFEKTTVVGDDAAPLFQRLGAPEWNFNKYLIDRKGQLRRQWGASTTPDDPELVGQIDALL
jgi:glutathione peroxidase